MRKYSQGVTLVELLVSLVIIGILVSVAVPSYRQYAIRANRADAHTALMQLAANQERFYLQNNTYATDAQLDQAPPNGLGMQTTTANDYYDIRINSSDATGFIAQATAKGGQADDTDCDVFAIDERGFRYGGPGPAITGTNDPACW